MAIFDIRGTHGSGKSHLVHTLLKKHKSRDIVEKGVRIGHYIPDIDCGIVGRYDRTCGGCDGIKTADEVVRRVRMLKLKCKRVVLEGILVSHTFKRYADLAQDLGDYNFLFLDPPLKVCIDRVVARRKERGNDKPFDPKNVKKDHERIWERLRLQVKEAGLNVYELPYQRAYAAFSTILMEG